MRPGNPTVEFRARPECVNAWRQAAAARGESLSAFLRRAADERMERMSRQEDQDGIAGSPVRDRTLRNHFEHIDDRIEASAEAGHFVGGNIMPSGAFYRSASMADRARSQLRNYDPETGLLSFWDDELDIEIIAAELARIGRAAGPRPLADSSADAD